MLLASLWNPKVYSDAGVKQAESLWQSAYFSDAAIKLRKEPIEKCLSFLGDVGINSSADEIAQPINIQALMN